MQGDASDLQAEADKQSVTTKALRARIQMKELHGKIAALPKQRDEDASSNGKESKYVKQGTEEALSITELKKKFVDVAIITRDGATGLEDVGLAALYVDPDVAPILQANRKVAEFVFAMFTYERWSKVAEKLHSLRGDPSLVKTVSQSIGCHHIPRH